MRIASGLAIAASEQVRQHPIVFKLTIAKFQIVTSFRLRFHEYPSKISYDYWTLMSSRVLSLGLR